MANVLAWSLFALGVVHIVFGIKKFRTPLAAAVTAGFVGQFKAPEERRTAFWFLVVGPLLMFAGQVAIHAVSTGDSWLLRLVGIYLFVTGAIGVAAFPRSPLWAPLLLSLLFIATGYGIV
jgi:hypothetical protein